MNEPIENSDAIFDLNQMAEKIRAGHEPSKEEVRKTIQALRIPRSVATTATTGKPKAKGLSKDAILDLFAEKKEGEESQ